MHQLSFWGAAVRADANTYIPLDIPIAIVSAIYNIPHTLILWYLNIKSNDESLSLLRRPHFKAAQALISIAASYYTVKLQKKAIYVAICARNDSGQSASAACPAAAAMVLNNLCRISDLL